MCYINFYYILFSYISKSLITVTSSKADSVLQELTIETEPLSATLSLLLRNRKMKCFSDPRNYILLHRLIGNAVGGYLDYFS